MFDVFLSHNGKDKPRVRQLGEALKNRGLSVWLDEWELVPGRPWQAALEEIIRTTKSAALLVGKDGMGPWEEAEMRACFGEFVKRQLPVIPVLLPDAPQQPDLPLFLQGLTWVDLRRGLSSEGLDRLQWGITGVKPETTTAHTVPTVVAVQPELEESVGIVQDKFPVGNKIVYGPKLVRIPAGTYSIGSEEDETKFQVINEFAIGQFPVTLCQYDLFCEVSGNEKPNDMGWGRENRPVINVSFFDAKKYIEWLCQRTGKEYRLPTEVEWEYAARAGTDSAYWWGNEIRRNDEIMANCNGCGDPWDKKRRTSPVGSFPSNDWKLYDTAGNVWEWTGTVYANNYKRDDRTEGEVPVDKSSRVIIKGGSWYDKPDRLHWSTRQPFWVDDKTDSIGFRVARSLPSLV